MSEAIIRPFDVADRERLNDLFARAGAGSPTANLWGHPASERAVYLDPYVDLEPQSLLLAEVDGRLVGYLTGCLDSAALPSEDERLERAMKEHGLLRRPRALGFFLRASVDLLGAKSRRRETAAGGLDDPRWPAHLHLNVAPEARGTGAATALMERWFARLEEHGSPGCHLQTLVENERAVRFFTRMGFRPYGTTPLVPGLRYRGGHVHQLTMVRPEAPAD